MTDLFVHENFQMTHNFAEDQRVQQAVKAYALEAVDLARNNFEIGLDWSDDSVVHVETMLGVFHDQLATSLLTEEQVFQIAKQCGSYVGEVFR